MELHDGFFVFIWVFVPVVHCGRLTDYLLLQKQLEQYLQTRASLPEDSWGRLDSQTRTRRDMLLYYNDTRWHALQTADAHRNVISPNPLSVISLSSPLHSRFLQFYDNWKSSKDKRDPHLRHTDFNVEILLVVDYSIYRRYLMENNYRVDRAKEKITEYYSILLAMVSQRFEVMSDRSFSIKAHICDIYIAETRHESMRIDNLSKWSEVFSNRVVSASRALRRFQKWLRRKKGLPAYDHAIVLTSYVLSKRRKQVDGLGYIGSMCKVMYGESASIVQDQGDYQSAAIIAHELGHSLGATHDGDEENQDCPTSKNYVMAPQVSRDIEVASNGSSQSKCLHNTPRTTPWFYSIRNNPPGQKITADEQCERSFGRHSTFCEHGASESSVCKRLWCTSPTENAMTCRSDNRLMALPGTSCGRDMQCHLGECVASHHLFYTRIRLRNDNCPRGDGNPIHCGIIIKASPYLCEERLRLREYCCESCGNHVYRR